MAFFQAKYSPAPARAKASFRYIQNRPGIEGKKEMRQLFSNNGNISRKEAYEIIDNAEQGSMYWRFIISPDARSEDTHKDLDMRTLIQKTIQEIEENLQKPVHWIAAEHTETENRHVHIVAVVNGFIPKPRGSELIHSCKSTVVIEKINLQLSISH